MFQCYCFKLSHPLLLLSPKVCSLHLCSLCCPICRIIDKDYSYVWSLPLKKKLPIQGYHIHFKLQNHIWGSNNLELLLNQLLKMSLQTIILSYFNFQFSSVTQPCPTLCIPMDCSTPGFPVHHQLPELAPTHVHWDGDAILPSHPLSSPCPPAFNLSQNQGLFQWVSSLHQLAKVLELQHLSFQWIFRTDWYPCSPKDSQESSPTPQFKSINSSVLSFPYGPTLTSTHDYWRNHRAYSETLRAYSR